MRRLDCTITGQRYEVQHRYSFDSDSHVTLGYDGSYRSLSTTLDKYIDIQEVVLTPKFHLRTADFYTV